jgi:hypothetical protein
MGDVFETVTRIQQIGGRPDRADRVAELRARFEGLTGAFTPDDPWFEERSRAFWCDAMSRARFGREVERDLTAEERGWLDALERSHRGLFRAASAIGPRACSTRALSPSESIGQVAEPGTSLAHAAVGGLIVDVWSGAEFAVTVLDEPSAEELAAASGQLFDARVVASADALTVALLPGAVFHPREATAPIEGVLAAARDRGLSTDATLDALLRMQRTFRSLSRVKAAYAYRPEALASVVAAQPRGETDAANRMRRAAKAPT